MKLEYLTKRNDSLFVTMRHQGDAFYIRSDSYNLQYLQKTQIQIAPL
jgi:hypothetical protein